MRLYQR